MRLRDRECQLSGALLERRDTGMAVGVLMERLRLDRRKAFETLRNGARARGRRIAELAAELLDAVECSNGLWDRSGEAVRKETGSPDRDTVRD